MPSDARPPGGSDALGRVDDGPMVTPKVRSRLADLLSERDSKDDAIDALVSALVSLVGSDLPIVNTKRLNRRMYSLIACFRPSWRDEESSK
jgi:hypothetical protein